MELMPVLDTGIQGLQAPSLPPLDCRVRPGNDVQWRGGRLAVGGRTTHRAAACFQTDDDRFADWHYRKDPTHVVFYREATMRTIAGQRGWTCEIPAKDVALMRRA